MPFQSGYLDFLLRENVEDMLTLKLYSLQYGNGTGSVILKYSCRGTELYWDKKLIDMSHLLARYMYSTTLRNSKKKKKILTIFLDWTPLHLPQNVHLTFTAFQTWQEQKDHSFDLFIYSQPKRDSRKGKLIEFCSPSAEAGRFALLHDFFTAPLMTAIFSP